MRPDRRNGRGQERRRRWRVGKELTRRGIRRWKQRRAPRRRICARRRPGGPRMRVGRRPRRRGGGGRPGAGASRPWLRWRAPPAGEERGRGEGFRRLGGWEWPDLREVEGRGRLEIFFARSGTRRLNSRSVSCFEMRAIQILNPVFPVLLSISGPLLLTGKTLVGIYMFLFDIYIFF